MSANERKFIHDLANPLAIAQGNIKLVLRNISKNPGTLPSEQVMTRLQKINDSIERISAMLSDRRQSIVESDQKDSDKDNISSASGSH